MTNRLTILAQLDDKVSTGLTKIRDNFDRLGKTQGFKQFTTGIGMGAGISAWNMLGSAVGKATDFVGESIGAASAMNETVSKTGVVFGDSARAVESWGNNTAVSMGIGKQAALDAAAGFGVFFNQAGRSQEAAADMGEEMVKLAGDLSSFYDLPTDVALEKLRSGLAGETEPLRQVGVFLTAANTKARALSMGLGDAHGELTEGEKILGRYYEILAQTTTQQGDYARTADSLANSQRRLNAQWDDATAKLGQALLPAATDVVVTLSQLLGQIGASADARGIWSGSIDAVSLSYERQKEVLAELDGLVRDDWSQTSKDNIELLRETVNSQSNLNARMERGKDGIRGLSNAYNKLADESNKLLDVNIDLRQSFKKLQDDASDTAETFGDLLFGEKDLHIQSRLLEGQLKDVKGELRDLEAIKDPTKDQRRSMDEARLEAHDLERQLLDVRAKLAALGDEASKDKLAEALKRADIRTIRLYKDLQIAYLKMLQLSRAGSHLSFLSSDTYGGDRPRDRHGNAYGGQLMTNTPYLVGEKGPELFVPRGSGELLPNHRLGGMTAGGGNVFVNVNASGVMTPATAQYLAQELGPTIATYLKRQNLIPARV